jgi:hypothetical protein
LRQPHTAWLEPDTVCLSAGICFQNRSHSLDEEDAIVPGQFSLTIEGQDVPREIREILVVSRNVAHPAVAVDDERAVNLDDLTES